VTGDQRQGFESLLAPFAAREADQHLTPAEEMAVWAQLPAFSPLEAIIAHRVIELSRRDDPLSPSSRLTTAKAHLALHRRQALLETASDEDWLQLGQGYEHLEALTRTLRDRAAASIEEQQAAAARRGVRPPW
jgi:hypothetical protein